ncbi:UNVERIFIED_CONTAM: hypothetical protein Sindi_0483400 [Sesamum indicum]
MKFLGVKPSFDNFWSLYSFTTSKRSGDKGFFYLSAKPDCRYLDTLKSNVGAWRDRFMFVRPPSGVTWPFKLEWSKYKSVLKTSGGGLEGDQINSLTSYKYDPKKLLTEKVLRLARLSPAPLHIEESLDSTVMSSCFALRLKAAENKVKANGKQVASLADPSSTPPAVPVPVPASPSSNHPIQGDEPREKRDRNCGEKSKKRKRGSHKHDEKAKEKGLVEPSGSSKFSPSNVPAGHNRWAEIMSRMAWEAAEKAEQQDERDQFQRLEGERAQLPKLEGNRIVPRWNISPSSSILFSQLGEDSWDIYDAGILPRDQGLLVTLAEELQKLKNQLAEAEKAKEVTLAEGRKEGFDAGRRIPSKPLLRSSLLTLSPKATKHVRLKSKTWWLQESFNRGQLDITLDGDLQPYPDEPDLEDDEFAAFREEIEADD